MWIKICGITQLEDAEMAIDAGADAIGFVFAESSRRVTPEIARKIREKIPVSTEAIGVFAGVRTHDIIGACRIAGLSGIQLHDPSVSDHTPNPATELRARRSEMPTVRRVIEVVHFNGDSTRAKLQFRSFHRESAAEDELPTVLVDTEITGRQGGTGAPFDWDVAQDCFREHASHLRLIVAGGLRPENVRCAIQTLQPWGIDVSSGVEKVPGRKDHKRMVEFIQIARAAAREFVETGQNQKNNNRNEKTK